jgi:enoyl-[acyl-carrier-protein] reductase (NADH)
LARRNALLVLWDSNEVENNKTNELLKSFGYKRARLFTVDVSNEENLRSTSKKIKEQIGDVSMIVNLFY